MFASRAERMVLFAFSALIVCAPMFAAIFPDSHIVRVLAFVCGLVLIACSAYFVSGSRLRLSAGHMAVLCLVVIGSVSALLSSYAGPRWWGIGFEFGMVGSLLLFAVSFFVGSSMPRYLVRLVPFGVTAVSAITSFYIVGVVVLGIPVRVLSAPWPVVAIMLSVTLAAAAHFVDASKGLRKWYAIPLIGIFAAGIWCMAHPAAWYVILVGALCSFVLLVRANTRPFFTAAVFLFGIVGLLYASHAPFIPAVPDIRPSIAASRNVLVPALFEGAPGLVFGTGPNGFSAAWDRYKPPGVNATPLWNMSFAEAHSSLLTLLASFGVSGFLAFLFAVGMSLYRGLSDQATDQFLITVTVGLLVAFCVFPVGVATFVLIGLCLGCMAPRDTENVQLSVSVKRSLIALLILIGCSVCYVASAQTGAAVYASRAANLSDSQQSAAVDLYARAVQYWPAPVYERDYAYAHMRRIHETLAAADDETRLDSLFAQDVALAVEMINKSVSPGIRDYSLWIDRAALFIALAQLGIAESESEATISLNQAAVLSPTSPVVPFMRALLAHAIGDRYEAQKYVGQALERKPDYADALSLYVELRASP